MARYIMSNRRAGKFRETQKIQSQAAVGHALAGMAHSVSVTFDETPQDNLSRRIVRFEADPTQIESMREDLPEDVILEPVILHTFDDAYRPAEFSADANLMSDPFPTGTGNQLQIRARGGNQNLTGAEIIVFFRGFSGLQTKATQITGSNGVGTFNYSSFWSPVGAIVVPAGNFWPMITRSLQQSPVTVACPAIPATGPIEWWHETMGIDRYSTQRGRGIRVGVIDSGVGPHGHLDHVTDVGSFIGTIHDPAGGADIGSHGTHVCGIIGARSGRETRACFSGVAPGVTLFSARVFPPGVGADQGDISSAIEHLSRDHEVDLINMSLGAKTGSQVELDAIRDARERGTLCICAAGNSEGPVEFPAAFPETVAVSALGKLGWGPNGSIPSSRLPQDPLKFGNENLYLANFSCFGSKITCSGPGVGVLSSVPERHGLETPYASMGGTSMSSPAVCGLLAAILDGAEEYKSSPRDETRTALAEQILRDSCVDIGMSGDYQGRGVPVV